MAKTNLFDRIETYVTFKSMLPIFEREDYRCDCFSVRPRKSDPSNNEIGLELEAVPVMVGFDPDVYIRVYRPACGMLFWFSARYYSMERYEGHEIWPIIWRRAYKQCGALHRMDSPFSSAEEDGQLRDRTRYKNKTSYMRGRR